MKSIFSLFLLSVIGGFLCSCGGDDDDKKEACIPGTFEETIVGSWDTPSLNPAVPAGEVTFNADGTGTTSESAAFDRGDLAFDWTYEASDSTLLVGPYIYELKELRCDEINLFSVAFDFTITRK